MYAETESLVSIGESPTASAEGANEISWLISFVLSSPFAFCSSTSKSSLHADKNRKIIVTSVIFLINEIFMHQSPLKLINDEIIIQIITYIKNASNLIF